MNIVSFFAALLDKTDIDLPQGNLTDLNIASVLRLVFGLAGAIALLIITIAGFKYTVSQGQPQEVAKAKDTILYALIGLAICIMGFAIVTFVVGKL